MNAKKFEYILITKSQVITNSIKNYFNINYSDARHKFYHSKLYRALENEETKMWYYSSYDLFNMFLEEIQTGDYTIYGG